MDSDTLRAAEQTINHVARELPLQDWPADSLRVECARLLICLGASAAELIPTTFAHRPEANQYLYVLKRLKGPPATHPRSQFRVTLPLPVCSA